MSALCQKLTTRIVEPKQWKSLSKYFAAPARRTRYLFPQDGNDLLFLKPAAPHRPTLHQLAGLCLTLEEIQGLGSERASYPGDQVQSMPLMFRTKCLIFDCVDSPSRRSPRL